MLYVFTGSDIVRRQQKVAQLLDALYAKKPDASFEKYDAESFDESRIPELVYGQGLFASVKVIELVGTLSEKETKEALLATLKELKASPNIIILNEFLLDAATTKKLEKFAEKIQAFEKKEGVKREVNPFAITDALARRDKKSLWLLFVQELEAGNAMEEVHGRLLWQVKAILLATQTKSAQEAGLKPFVYQKAKAAGRVFSLEEMKEASRELVSLYHRAHRGEVDFAKGLERWVLGV